MTLERKSALRLQFLARVVRKECRHLVSTDLRLFNTPFTVEVVVRLETDQELAGRVEAFVGRFGRLQDTVGDKLLPQLLYALGEKLSSALDNLDRAERLGLIKSADEWAIMRSLRNQMVHEYVEEPALLADALQAAHSFVPDLVVAADRMISEIERRGWA